MILYYNFTILIILVSCHYNLQVENSLACVQIQI